VEPPQVNGFLQGQIFTTQNSVGIGAINPAYKLDVSGDLRVTGNIYGNIIGTTLVSVTTGLTSNYTANVGDYYIGVNGARKVTLPLGSSISVGKSYVVIGRSGECGCVIRPPPGVRV